MKSYESTRANFVTLHKTPSKTPVLGYLTPFLECALLFFVTFDASFFFAFSVLPFSGILREILSPVAEMKNFFTFWTHALADFRFFIHISPLFP